MCDQGFKVDGTTCDQNYECQSGICSFSETDNVHLINELESSPSNSCSQNCTDTTLIEEASG